MNALKNLWRSIQPYLKTPEIIYSVSLIVLIPILIAVNSIVVIRLFTQVVDSQAKDKAAIAEQLVTRNITSTDQHVIQQQINDLAENIKGNSDQSYFQRLDYLTKQPGSEAFLVIASSDPKRVGQSIKPAADLASGSTQNPDDFTQLNLTWTEKTDYVSDSRENNTPGYQVTGLVANPSGERLAVVSSFVSRAYIDGLLTSAFTRSGALLTLTVFITLLLLFVRSRIYRYSTLFRRLQEVDQMKDEFISEASHELRAPLTAIRGNLDLLLNQHDLDETQKAHMIAAAERSAEQLTALVADLLDVSRIEQSRLQLRPETIDIEKAISPIVEDMRTQAKSKNLTLEFLKPTEPLSVSADAQKLRQIVVNLISNAIKYTEKGSVRISAGIEHDHVAILVSDTGIGMSPEDRANLFKKFYRIRTAETAKISGTGLGLWITKSLVEMMGGQIYVDSIKGAGTQVKFTLPKA